jgi:hypothetical protein
MKWRITYPYRETLKYECEKGTFHFDMAWGSEIPILFVSGNTFLTADGTKLPVSDEEMDLFMTRFREHCRNTGSEITISRSRDDKDHLPSHYK